jgi:formylglycine-generating enzyme required for sulfatase activity
MREYLVLRGGSYFNAIWDLRTSYRYWDEPDLRIWDCGFRVVVVRRQP